MSGLFVLREGGPLAADTARRLEAAFRKQGFPAPRKVARSGLVIAAFGPIFGDAAPLLHESAGGESAGGDAIAAAGSLFYRGRFGADALPVLLRDMRGDRLDTDTLWGSFAVAAIIDGAPRLLTDSCGTLPVYRAAGGRITATSFLAVAEALDHRSIDADGVYDTVFQGAPHGGRTVFREITRVDTARVPHHVALHGDRLDASVDRCLEALLPRFEDMVTTFGDSLDTALSGGYDSRLVLALLRRAGVRPAVHVYGRPTDPDVLVAQAIAAAEGIPLKHEDKSTRPLPVAEAFGAVIERNLLSFDGVPNDGLFVSPADLETRRERTAPGRLALNGGGGEVFRNFFYLRDTRFTPRQMVDVFWHQFDPAVGGPRFDVAAYREGLAERIGACVGVPADEALERPLVEALYPWFRCRWWMGRNNGVNNRLGPAVTPFVDGLVAARALSVPLTQKNHGRLQAAMIARIDPRLARYPSAYGHAFDGPPPVARRLKDWATYGRPAWLRGRSYRLHRFGDDLPPPLTDPYRRAVLGREQGTLIGDYLRLERLRDPGQLNRALSLEYLFRRLPPQTASAAPPAAA